VLNKLNASVNCMIESHQFPSPDKSCAEKIFSFPCVKCRNYIASVNEPRSILLHVLLKGDDGLLKQSEHQCRPVLGPSWTFHFGSWIVSNGITWIPHDDYSEINLDLARAQNDEAPDGMLKFFCTNMMSRKYSP
jgi:hypothetical protein